MRRLPYVLTALSLIACGPESGDDPLASGSEYETLSTKTVSEQVKCVFHGATDAQECYSDLGFGCKGIGACVADLKGENGKKLTWKSSCGGYAFTILDGKSEAAEFKCGATPPPPPPPTVVEQVKCVFNSNLPQACYSDQGDACKGIGTCVVDLKGAFGQKLTWKSTCGGYAFTVLDGKSEYAEFKCGTVPPPPPPPIVAEQVKCVFLGSKNVEECASDLGFGCKGIGGCVADLKGAFGQKLTWKSSCGGYAYTLLDGVGEVAEFKCGAIPPPPPPPPAVAEQVKCVFKTTLKNMPTAQECMSDLGFGCKGIGSCLVDVKGATGQKLLWKSTCGGYATTLLDGKDEAAEFDCDPQPPPPPPPPPQTVVEQVKCIFHGSTAVQECISDLGLGCKGIGTCLVDIKGPAGQKLLWKSSCGGYATTLLDGTSEVAEFSCGLPSK